MHARSMKLMVSPTQLYLLTHFSEQQQDLEDLNSNSIVQSQIQEDVVSAAVSASEAVSAAVSVSQAAAVSQIDEDWVEIGGTPWEILQDEFISKFGSQHDINLDAEFGTTDEAEGGIAMLNSWLERNNPTEEEAEKARVWIARFQRCLAGEYEDDPNAFESEINQTLATIGSGSATTDAAPLLAHAFDPDSFIPAAIDTASTADPPPYYSYADFSVFALPAVSAVPTTFATIASASRSITTVAAPSALAPPATVESSPPAVIDTAPETAVAAPPTAALSPLLFTVLSPVVVVPAAVAEPNPASAWAEVLQELQAKFGIEQEVVFDAQVHEVEAAITKLADWMNTDFAAQAIAWSAKLQLFVENESVLDNLFYGLEDNLVALAAPLIDAPVVAPPVANPPPVVVPPATIIPTVPTAMTRPTHLSAFRAPSMLSRPRQSTPPIVSRNLSKARPMGLVRRPRSALTELPPNTPDE